jgi:hypothetical protein
MQLSTDTHALLSAALPDFDEWDPAAMTHMLEARGVSSVDLFLCFRRYSSSSSSSDAECWPRFVRYVSERRSPLFKHVETVAVTDKGVFAYTVDLHDAARPGSGYVRELARDPATYHMYPAPTWHCVRLATLSDKQRLGVLYYSSRQCGKPMNKAGMYLNFCSLLASLGASQAQESARELDTYFCSQLIACCLRWVGISIPLDTATITPTDLYIWLSARHHFEEVSFERAVATTASAAPVTAASAIACSLFVPPSALTRLAFTAETEPQLDGGFRL